MRGAIRTAAAALAVAGLLVAGCLGKADNKPPTAVFHASSNAVNVGQDVVFDAQNSTDRDGRIVRYHWDFGDLSEDLGVSTAHDYSEGGDYTVTLTVTDNEGKKDRTNLTVHVNEYPRARVDCGGEEQKVGAEITFSGANSSDPDGSVVRWSWDFGDGGSASGASVKHAYSDTGSFSVNLTVADDRGAEDRETLSVNVVLRTFEVTWRLARRTVPQLSGESEENGTVNKTVALPFENMTSASFALAWRDDIPRLLGLQPNDDFQLRVADPDNNTRSGRSPDENITLDFGLADPPAPLTLKARTTSEVELSVGVKYSKHSGQGNWTVQVWLGEAGGAQEIIGEDLDRGNGWRLEVSFTIFEMVITEK